MEELGIDTTSIKFKNPVKDDEGTEGDSSKPERNGSVQIEMTDQYTGSRASVKPTKNPMDPVDDDEDDPDNLINPFEAETSSKSAKDATVNKEETTTNSGGGWFGLGNSEENEEVVDEEEQALLHADAGVKTEAEQEADDEEEMKEQVRSIKNATGLWDEDQADSSWINFTQKDHNTGQTKAMGSLSISLQIWPKEKAEARPVGAGRNTPNENPFLPPPVGRLRWSWNPFVLGSQLCGPKLCAGFTCCLVCTAFIVLMIFCQPFLNIIINLIFVVFGA